MDKFKHGDILRNPNGLVGKLVLKEGTPECEVRSLEDAECNWLVRSWSVADLRKVGWRKVTGVFNKYS